MIKAGEFLVGYFHILHDLLSRLSYMTPDNDERESPNQPTVADLIMPMIDGLRRQFEGLAVPRGQTESLFSSLEVGMERLARISSRDDIITSRSLRAELRRIATELGEIELPIPSLPARKHVIQALDALVCESPDPDAAFFAANEILYTYLDDPEIVRRHRGLLDYQRLPGPASARIPSLPS